MAGRAGLRGGRRSSGAFAGVAAAHVMFELPLFFASRHARQGPAQMFSEFVATFGLLAVIWGCARLRSAAVPFAVAAYITAAYWFTASTSFANPAVTLARAATDTFAGDPARRRARLHRGPAPGRGGRDAAVPLAGAGLAQVRARRRRQGDCRPVMSRERVLFLCTHNSARSQMAEGFLARVAGDRFEVESAGTEETAVNLFAIRAMGEVGVDLHGHRSNTLDRFLDQPWDYVITVCDSANERCPIFPGAPDACTGASRTPRLAPGVKRSGSRSSGGSETRSQRVSAPG